MKEKMMICGQNTETLYISPDEYHTFKIISSIDESSKEFKKILQNINYENWIDLSEPILSFLAFAYSMIEEGSKKRLYTFSTNSDLDNFINSFTGEQQKKTIVKARFAVLLNNFSLDVLEPYCLTLFPTDYKRRCVFPVRVLFQNISSRNLEFLRVAFWFFAYIHTHTEKREHVFVEALYLHLSLSDLVKNIESMLEDKTNDECFIVGNASKFDDLILKN